jgi:DNA-directed RNA polymerase subunit E'/Rpb7
MKILGLLVVVGFLSGCVSSVRIVEGRVTAVDEKSVTVELRTEEDLRSYQNSYWAVRVRLEYEPQKVQSVSRSEAEPVARSFVFAVQPESLPERAADGYFQSIWKIPRTRNFAWALTDYSYKIEQGEEVRVRIGGGTMHGTTVRSEELRLKVPNSERSDSPERESGRRLNKPRLR